MSVFDVVGLRRGRTSAHRTSAHRPSVLSWLLAGSVFGAPRNHRGAHRARRSKIGITRGRTGGVGTGISSESGEVAGEVSDNFPDSAGFCVAVADVAARAGRRNPCSYRPTRSTPPLLPAFRQESRRSNGMTKSNPTAYVSPSEDETQTPARPFIGNNEKSRRSAGVAGGIERISSEWHPRRRKSTGKMAGLGRKRPFYGRSAGTNGAFAKVTRACRQPRQLG